MLEILRLFPACRFNLQPISGFFITDSSNRTPSLLFFTFHQQIFPAIVHPAQQLYLDTHKYTQNSTRFNELVYSYVTAIYPS